MNIVRILILSYTVIGLVLLMSAFAPTVEYETNTSNSWSDNHKIVPLPSPSEIPEDPVEPPEIPRSPPESPPVPQTNQDDISY